MHRFARTLPWRLLPFLLLLSTGTALARQDTPAPAQYSDVAMAMVADLDHQLVPRLGMYTTNNSRGLYWVVITTPANLGNLNVASPLARLFGQELASSFVGYGYNVQEIRRASDIIFSRGQGEFTLTRDVRALANRRAMATLVVAGTYTVTPAGVRYNIEVVDARNNTIVAMTSRTVPMNATVAALSQDDGLGTVVPTVSTTDPTRFRREMEATMARHW